ncbi:MAG: flagellar assembly protein FliW [Oligoflexia bacterium]|nr:flagellar assembly protein FliW [Oligoflexia bacterium]
MVDEKAQKGGMFTLKSSRFGELEVPTESIIEFPQGLIGFPNANRFVLLEHKPPFSWLHSIDDPSLAFVVVDGFEFGPSYEVKPPYNNRECDFRQGDEFAILVIVTVRPDPKATTANLKAPLFVNLKNRRGAQVIFDDARYSTRFPLWAENEAGSAEDSEKKKS